MRSSSVSTATTISSTTPRPIRLWSTSAARCCGTASSTRPVGTPAPAPWASCWAILRVLIIRNCIFRNQPDSGSHDEGGIDFENRGNGCLIEHCTFENNAGAAIEVLGLKSPQTTNIEVRNSRFIKNNVAKKLGPAEIYVWGQLRDPAVCCSTGVIHWERLCHAPRHRVLHQRGSRADFLDAARQHLVCHRRGTRRGRCLSTGLRPSTRGRASGRTSGEFACRAVRATTASRRGNRCRRPGKSSRGRVRWRSTISNRLAPWPPSSGRATTSYASWPTTASSGSAACSQCTSCRPAPRWLRPGSSTRTWTKRGGPRCIWARASSSGRTRTGRPRPSL